MNFFGKKKKNPTDDDSIIIEDSPQLTHEDPTPPEEKFRIPVDADVDVKNEEPVNEIVDKKTVVRRAIPKNIHFYLLGVICFGMAGAILFGSDKEQKKPKKGGDIAVVKEEDSDNGKKAIARMASGIDAANASAAATAEDPVAQYLKNGTQQAGIASGTAAGVGVSPNPAMGKPSAQLGSFGSLPPPPVQGARSAGSPTGGKAQGGNGAADAQSSANTEQNDRREVLKSKLIKLLGVTKSTSSTEQNGQDKVDAIRASKQSSQESSRALMAAANGTRSTDASSLGMLRQANNQATNQQTAAAVSEQWAKDSDRVSSPTLIKSKPAAAGCDLLHQGKIIPAVMEVSLNSDLPGNINGVITQNVYDSVCGHQLLIPKGSRFYGQYGSQIQNGQARLMAGVNRIIMPNGVTIDLGQMSIVDRQGTAGTDADVNNHIVKQVLSGIMLATITGAIDYSTRSSQNVSGGTVNNGVTSAGQVMTETSKRVLDRFTNIPPTLTVARGTRFNIMVNKDIQLPAYR